MRALKLPLILLSILLTSLCFAESHYVYLGRFDLAGMVPDTLPAQGASLEIKTTDLSLLTEQNIKAGYIPGRFRHAINLMQSRGLNVQVEVNHVYAQPLPGKFISVDLWVHTWDPSLISPLIYTIPVQDPFDLASLPD